MQIVICNFYGRCKRLHFSYLSLV